MKNISIKKYDYIDAIRGYAILGVVLVHSSQWVHPLSDIFSKIAKEGARGVQLFYIVSALTLFLSMAARKEQEKKPVLSFFIRRFFRIAPLFYCAIIVYTSYYGLSPRYWAPNGIEWWFIPLTALFIHGWHPETITSVVPGGWSIAVEMTFYSLVPYLFLKLTNIKQTLIALFISLLLSWTISIVADYFYQPYYPNSHQYLVEYFTFFWFFSQFPVFILGILLYHIIVKYPQADTVTGMLMLFVSIFLFTAFMGISTYRDLIPKHFLYGIAFLIFSLSLHFLQHGFLVNRLIVLIGRLSFSIYLVHFGVLIIMRRVFSTDFILNGDIGFILAFVCVLFLSVIISHISNIVIETPGIKLGKYFLKKL